MDFKEINIGQMIEKRVAENFFKCTEDEVEKMYQAKSLDTEILLKWSKLLDYDFFRIYTQHLILYSPPSAKKEQSKNKKSSFPQFRKNIYSREIIDFILEELKSGNMTKKEVIEKYNIPRTTLYKWISKYRS